MDDCINIDLSEFDLASPKISKFQIFWIEKL